MLTKYVSRPEAAGILQYDEPSRCPAPVLVLSCDGHSSNPYTAAKPMLQLLPGTPGSQIETGLTPRVGAHNAVLKGERKIKGFAMDGKTETHAADLRSFRLSDQA